jgi:predicted nucleotidyltransferase
MKSIPEKPEEVFDQFSNDIEKLFDKEVVSIVLFGSAATDEYIPKKSDINFLVILTQEGIEQIGKVQRFVSRWQKRGISLPLFLTRGYIKASLDSFPIEFLNMQAAYRVIKGEDVLKGIKIKKRDLRLQCERELKGNLLKLRQGFIQTGGKAKALKLLITGSIVAFTSIFRALLHLRGKIVLGTKQEILLATCREFGLNEGLFSVLLSLRRGGAKLTCGQLEENGRRYISEIQKLSEFVDQMKFGK